MKTAISRYLVPVAGGLVALGVVLYFVSPWAPLLLLVSVLIQAPVVWLLVTSSYKNSYLERTRERVQVFEKSKDAHEWLLQEEKELNSLGRKYWSKSGENLSALNRAQIYAALGDWPAAYALLETVESKRLPTEDLPRYRKLMAASEGTSVKE